MFKRGLEGGTHTAGRTRLGGPQGIKFRHNGKRYNAGTPATEETIRAASAYFNNPNSPLTIRFGGNLNTGFGTKLGRAYGVNPVGASKIAAMELPMATVVNESFPTDYHEEDDKYQY